MVRRTGQSVALILVLLGAGTLAAQSPPTDAALDELMHVSGLWEQLPQFETMVREGFAEAMAKNHERADDAAAKVLEAVAAAYSGDRLRATVRRELATALTAEDVAGIVAWLGTDLGVRITALEGRAGEPEQQALLKAEAPKLLADTPPARVEQIQELLRALRWGESMASILIHTSEGITRGLAVEDPAAAAAALAQLQATMGAQRAAMAQALEKESVATFVFIYRNLTEPELAGYLEFIESPLGQHYQAATLAAIDKTLAEAAESLGRMLAATKST